MSTPPPQTADQQREDRFMRALRYFGWFWTGIIYTSLALNTYSTWTEQPDLLRGWTLAGLGVLLATFLGLYHRVYIPATACWPMPSRRALLYFGGQLAVLLLLLRYHAGFGWLAFALLGHITSILHPRQWPLPITGVLLVFGAPFGLYPQLLGGDWVGVLSFVFNTAIILAIFITIALLFAQRFKLADTVRELRQAKQQLETNAMQIEELAVLRERTRLAREMHDSLGHALVVVNVKLEAAQRLYGVDAARGAAELEATKTLVRDAMADLRRSLGDLRAPLGEHHDLPAALHQLAEATRHRSHLQVTCSTANDTTALAPAATEALWRVAREALANVERHAHATEATLCLERCNGSVLLHIADNGSGIDARATERPGHYGVLGMRERIAAVGGALQIAPRAGGGTLVAAHVPIAHAPRPGSDEHRNDATLHDL